jgi:hypothetical protein
MHVIALVSLGPQGELQPPLFFAYPCLA